MYKSIYTCVQVYPCRLHVRPDVVISWCKLCLDLTAPPLLAEPAEISGSGVQFTDTRGRGGLSEEKKGNEQ